MPVRMLRVTQEGSKTRALPESGERADHGEQGHEAYNLSPQHVRICDTMCRYGRPARLPVGSGFSGLECLALSLHSILSRVHPFRTYTHVKE
jgi:hypothetical protein